MVKKNAKLIYAQSSDIKARTYIEYRRDMKKKAIAELEIKEWLEKKLKKAIEKGKIEGIKVDKKDMKNIKVEKYGGDKFLWFLREGGVTREPDFIVHISEDKNLFVEFQYADKEDLAFFDFKLSKVSKKIKGERIPHEDRIFLYILKNSLKYAFIKPEWIAKHGKIGVVPAWGSRQAYRVPKKDFEIILTKDNSLAPIIKSIDAKIAILNFQYQLLNIWENKLSKELQGVIDEEKLVKIMPKTLDGFFKVCFILDHLHKIPENVKLWFIYILSYVNKKLNLKEIAMLTYSLDFLYSKISSFEENELKELTNKIGVLLKLINSYHNQSNGLYNSSIKESPLDETKYALFSINLIEDIIQDAIYYHGAKFKPITKIYQYVKNPLKISEVIQKDV